MVLSALFRGRGAAQVAPNILEAENARLAAENARLKADLAAARNEDPKKYSRREGRSKLAAIEGAEDVQTQKYIRSQVWSLCNSPAHPEMTRECVDFAPHLVAHPLV